MDDLFQRVKPMDKPNERDGVVCPNSSNSTPHPPAKVYDTIENGKPVRRGIIAPHKHGWIKKDECEYSGLPVPVVPRKVPEKERVPESERTQERGGMGFGVLRYDYWQFEISEIVWFYDMWNTET